MLTFLFWNLQKKPLLSHVGRICADRGVDVLILTECIESNAQLLTVVQGITKGNYQVPKNFVNRRFRVLTQVAKFVLKPVFDDRTERLSIWRLQSIGVKPILISIVHLPALFGESRSGLDSIAQQLSDHVRRIEDEEGHTRTLIVGDFNMSPFDNAMVNGYIFHALMTRELAERRNNRMIQGEQHRTCFNPMWQFLMDRDEMPAGTYYFRDSQPVNHFWYALDQVLVRPELMGKLKSVEILTQAGDLQLTVPDGGWPDTDSGSDHLPLLFSLDLGMKS